MKHFVDFLRKKDISLQEEFIRIRILLMELPVIQGTPWHPSATLLDVLDSVSPHSKFKGTSVSARDGFNRAIAGCFEKRFKIGEEGFFLFSEMCYCLLVEAIEFSNDSCNYATLYDYRSSISEAAVHVMSNIDKVLEKLGYKMELIESQQVWMVVAQDEVVEAAAAGSNENVADLLSMYRRSGSHGNVQEKKSILLSLARVVEPMCQDRKLNEMTSGLCKRISQALNTLDIRHNNREGKNAKQLLMKLDEKELEPHYDEIVEMIVALLAEHRRMVSQQDLDSFLGKVEEAEKKNVLIDSEIHN